MLSMLMILAAELTALPWCSLLLFFNLTTPVTGRRLESDEYYESTFSSILLGKLPLSIALVISESWSAYISASSRYRRRFLRSFIAYLAGERFLAETTRSITVAGGAFWNLKK